MRVLPILGVLLRIQVLLGLVEYVGLFVGFAWPPSIWAAHRIIALLAPVVAFFAFRRSAWTRVGLPPLDSFEPRSRVTARFALLAPLALGLCFSTGVVGGRGWITVHIALAIAALFVIERASGDLRVRIAPANSSDEPQRSSEVRDAV